MTIASGSAALASDLLEEHDADGTHTIDKVLASAMNGNGTVGQLIESDGDGTYSYIHKSAPSFILHFQVFS